MNEKRILFSSEMVKAILEGRKTQARRVMKPQPTLVNREWRFAGAGWTGSMDVALFLPGHSLANRFPYGQISDRLWVRESWRIVGWSEDGDWQVEYKDSSAHWFDSVQEVDEETSVRYWEQCTDDCDKAKIPTDENGYYTFDEHPCPTRWRPSIHMPRWASRITLEIVDVRVERVQRISQADAKAEGMSNLWKWDKTRYAEHPEHFVRGVLNPYVANYSVLWDDINSKRGYGWDVNPWVWVIEFKRVTS